MAEPVLYDVENGVACLQLQVRVAAFLQVGDERREVIEVARVHVSPGLRHRAAIGLTEETDAVVIVVSEEEGKISLVREGRITRDVDAGTLRSALQQLVA